MKRPSILSESLHQRLNSYALAASAAGVSVLGLISPTEFVLPAGVAVASLFSFSESAEAKIVHTHAHAFINCGTSSNTYTINMKSATFKIVCFEAGHSSGLTVHVIGKKNEVLRNPKHWAAALSKGKTIGSNSLFFNYATINMWGCSYKTCYGPWYDVDRYLGLKFFIKGKAHYGWAQVSSGHPVEVVNYAYETIPNKPIIAGKTHGKDVITVQPATLGHLARGASALPSWRAKEGQ